MDTDCISSFFLGAQMYSLTLGLCPLKVSGSLYLNFQAVPHMPNRIYIYSYIYSQRSAQKINR